MTGYFLNSNTSESISIPPKMSHYPAQTKKHSLTYHKQCPHCRDRKSDIKDIEDKHKQLSAEAERPPQYPTPPFIISQKMRNFALTWHSHTRNKHTNNIKHKQ